MIISTQPSTERTKGNELRIVVAKEEGPAFFDVEKWARETASEGHYFDEEAASRACAFFPRYLRHTKGKRWSGKPFVLEPWEKSIIRSIFGWKNKADGTRRFRIVYIEIGRKNGKTQLAAGIALYMAFCDNEPGAEVYSVANDKKQAGICFNEAAKMRKASNVLLERTLASKFSIFNNKYGQCYQYLSSDHGNKDGLNASCVIYDEFHAFKDRALYDVMHTSTGMRDQPLEIIITTAGLDKNSICWTQRVHAEKVRDRIIVDDEFLPVIYAADKDDDYRDPRVWAKANPNLGVTLKTEYMHKQIEKCENEPSYIDTFRRLHLNIWVECAKRWLQIDKWNTGGPPREAPLGDVYRVIKEEEEKLKGRRCYAGLDLARVSDLSALVLLFPPIEEKEPWKIIIRAWCPEDNILTRSKRDRVPYTVWRDFGFLTPTPGNTTDFKFIEKDIVDLSGQFDIVEIAYDRTFAGELINNLTEEGLPLVEFGQGFMSMAAPTAELERMVMAGNKLWHGGHPIARWNAGNVVVKKDPAGNIKPDKEKSTDRIDIIVALIEALGRAIAAPKEKKADLGAMIESGTLIM